MLDAIGCAGQEIHLIPFWRAHVCDFAPAPLQFNEHRCLQCVTQIGSPAAIEQRDEPSVYRIDLARVDHALAPRVRFHPHRAHQKAVLQISEQVVEGVARNGDSLALEGTVEFLNAESACGIGQEMSHEPAKPCDVGDTVTLDHIAQNGHVHVIA